MAPNTHPPPIYQVIVDGSVVYAGEDGGHAGALYTESVFKQDHVVKIYESGALIGFFEPMNSLAVLAHLYKGRVPRD